MKSDQLIFYTTLEGNIKVEVFYEGETFWLTQKAMANLFGVEVPAVSKHLANIFATNELVKMSTISILETIATACNADLISDKIVFCTSKIIGNLTEETGVI